MSPPAVNRGWTFTRALHLPAIAPAASREDRPCSINHSPLEGESQKSSRETKADAVGETTVQLHAAERAAMLPDLDGNPSGMATNRNLWGLVSSPHSCESGNPDKPNRYFSLNIRDQWFMPLISVRLVRPGTGCSE